MKSARTRIVGIYWAWIDDCGGCLIGSGLGEAATMSLAGLKARSSLGYASPLGRPMEAHSPEPQPGSYWCQTSGGLALYRDAADQRPLMEAGKPLAALAFLALSPGGRAQRDHVAELLFWIGTVGPLLLAYFA